MSVQSEITRLANAKTALATAIEGKGVTVPEGTKLDGMAALIERIEAGGGVELQYNRLYSAATGTFTPAERTKVEVNSPLVIEHNAGIIPFVVKITSNDMAAAGDLEFIVAWRIPHYAATYYDRSQLYSVLSKRGSSSTNRSTKYGNIYSGRLDTWDIKNVVLAQGDTIFYVDAGKTYTWTVYGIE